MKIFAMVFLFLILSTVSLYADCYDDLINGIGNEAQKRAAAYDNPEVSFKLVNGVSREIYIALSSGSEQADSAAIEAVRRGTKKITQCPDFQKTLYFNAQFTGKEVALSRIDGVEFNSYRENHTARPHNVAAHSTDKVSDAERKLYEARLAYANLLARENGDTIPHVSPKTEAEFSAASAQLAGYIEYHETKERRKKTIVFGALIILVAVVAAGIVSGRKRRSVIKWIIGTALFPPAIIVLLFLPSLTENKKCPFCAETVNVDAIVCKHCKKDLPMATPGEQG